MRRLQGYDGPPLACGQGRMWWLGQMGLMVRLGGTRLCVDYFAAAHEKRRTAPPVPAQDLRDVDVFLGTHDHLDHMDHESWRIFKDACPNARFVFPAAHLDRALADGIDRARLVPLNDGESAVLGDVIVRAVAAAHEFLDRDEETGFYPALMYVLEGNGLRILHMGDTLRYEGLLPRLRAFGPIDAALLPINGRDAERYERSCIGNMTFQEAVDLAGELGVRLAIPGHWDMFADNSADPDAFASYLRVKYQGRVPGLIPSCGALIGLSAPPSA